MFVTTKDNLSGHYIGPMKDGMPHGRDGTLVTSNGNVWFGEWVEGKRGGSFTLQSDREYYFTYNNGVLIWSANYSNQLPPKNNVTD